MISMSHHILYVIKSTRMSLAGHLACVGELGSAYRFWLGNLREQDQLADPGIDGRIILKRIFWGWDGRGAWTGFLWLRIWTGGMLL